MHRVTRCYKKLDEMYSRNMLRGSNHARCDLITETVWNRGKTRICNVSPKSKPAQTRALFGCLQHTDSTIRGPNQGHIIVLKLNDVPSYRRYPRNLKSDRISHSMISSGQAYNLGSYTIINLTVHGFTKEGDRQGEFDTNVYVNDGLLILVLLYETSLLYSQSCLIERQGYTSSHCRISLYSSYLGYLQGIQVYVVLWHSVALGFLATSALS